MAGSSPIVLILGAGPNIGQAVARTFVAKGYKVALASRSLDETKGTESQLDISSDFTKSDGVVNAFEKVKKVFGIPSVVVYNGNLPRLLSVKISNETRIVSASTLSPPQDPFALPLADFNLDATVNITNSFIAAQQAVLGFAQLPASASRTFILTGNILNVAIIPGFISQGMGKSAGAHMIWAASEAYKEKGYK